jgi:hypothetical protein
VTCAGCGASNDEGTEWCERCLRRFDYVSPPPPVPPAGAFLRTGSTNLTRQFARGPLVYVEPGGDLQATVLVQRHGRGQGEGLADAVLTGDSLRHLDDRHTVLDIHDVPLFYVERYRAAAAPSFAVFEPGGDALAVYLSGNPFIVRDGTGAPMAQVHPRPDRFEMVETGGEAIAQCWRSDVDLGWLVDHQWGLTVLEEPRVLDRRGLVAWPLVCRLLWSDGVPRHKQQQHPGATVGAGIAGDLAGDVLGAALTFWV